MNDTTTNANDHNDNAASNFIDFYQLLGADNEATTTALRRRINDLDTEAQSNRDHRSPTKRRRYEALCELLPYCRIVLLDPDKRARYDRYREQFEAGTAVPSFEQMMDEIAGRINDDLTRNSDEKIGLPGVEGDDNYLSVTPGTLAGASLRSPNPPLPHEKHAPGLEPRRSDSFDKPSPRAAASRVTSSSTESAEPAFSNLPPALYTRENANGDANAVAKTTGKESDVAPQPAPSSGSSSGSVLTPLAYAVMTLLAGALASYFLFHLNWDRSLLVGFVLSIVAYVLSNARGTRSKSGSKRPNRIS